MTRKPKKEKYPAEVYLEVDNDGDMAALTKADLLDSHGITEVAIYQYVRTAKVKRKVEVE